MLPAPVEDVEVVAAGERRLEGGRGLCWLLRGRLDRFHRLRRRFLARLQVLQQPNQLLITTGLPLQPTRRPDLVDVAIKVELQQIGRIIGRLPHFQAAIRMTELELRKVEETNEAFDRAHRIVPPNIVLNPSRKQTGLFSALAGLERMIRHEPNRTSTPENSRYSCPVSSGKSPASVYRSPGLVRRASWCRSRNPLSY